MLLVYVAGPFRGENSWIMENNIRNAEALALEVWRRGCACICPHTNTRFFQGAADDSVWLDGDIEIMNRCDVVIFTKDYKKSSGAIKEEKVAKERNIPCIFSLKELDEFIGNK